MAGLGEDVSEAVGPGGQKSMRWTSLMSSYMLQRLVDIIGTGVKTDKGFKEVHLNQVARALTDYVGVQVTRTQVYNHLRKWRARWIRISKLRDLSRALWDDKDKMIVLEEQHYMGHVKDHPKDIEFLNVPLENYVHMEVIFSSGQATGKYAMASNQPLGVPIEVDGPEYGHEGSGGVDGAAGFDFDVETGATTSTPGKAASSSCGKRKRSSPVGEDDAVLFNNMSSAVREMAAAIKSTVHAEAHPEVYKAVMDLSDFPLDSRLAVLDHLMEKKPISLAFVQMEEDVRASWVRRFLAKHPDA